MKYFFLLPILILANIVVSGQAIADFLSLEPLGQNTDLVIPETHVFQTLIETNDPLTAGGTLPGKLDFTGYVPIANSSSNGYVSINQELVTGGVAVLDVNFNALTGLWQVSASEAINFASVGGTSANCSGTVTSWGTVITCEEVVLTTDFNSDGYNDRGWALEVDPANKKVLSRLFSLGCFKHENAVIHQNDRTLYQGADSNPGYLFKFVADQAQNLQSGTLYVYKGSKNGSGSWIELTNNSSSANDQNNTLALCTAVNATEFNGVEDVEIGPDGMVYFAVKNESVVYRFRDSDPLSGITVPLMETYVGGDGVSYDIEHANGTTNEPWGRGNDNLAFDKEGNLWVMQDGDDNYIWVVRAGHTTSCPRVQIFGRTPAGSEPTGITFSPDNRFLFMSIQHPSASNSVTSQTDAAGNSIDFSVDAAIVIARKGDLGGTCQPAGTPCNDGDPTTFNDQEDGTCNCTGIQLCSSGQVCVSPKILLTGPYTNSGMSEELYGNCLVPESEPYTALGLVLNNQGAVLSRTARSLLGNQKIIDWVAVQLRNASGSAVFSQAALLQQDGDIVGTDGSSTISFSNIPAGSYHVVVRHRNHLAVMTGSALITVN